MRARLLHICCRCGNSAGKFIFIEPEELASVAKFIKRKGRVRISALAQESNKLIDLSPRTIAVEEEPTEEPTGEGA